MNNNPKFQAGDILIYHPDKHHPKEKRHLIRIINFNEKENSYYFKVIETYFDHWKIKENGSFSQRHTEDAYILFKIINYNDYWAKLNELP